jgi:hypothetical protein
LRLAAQYADESDTIAATSQHLGEIITSVLRVGDALIRGDTERLAGILKPI